MVPKRFDIRNASKQVSARQVPNRGGHSLDQIQGQTLFGLPLPRAAANLCCLLLPTAAPTSRDRTPSQVRGRRARPQLGEQQFAVPLHLNEFYVLHVVLFGVFRTVLDIVQCIFDDFRML